MDRGVAKSPREFLEEGQGVGSDGGLGEESSGVGVHISNDTINKFGMSLGPVVDARKVGEVVFKREVVDPGDEAEGKEFVADGLLHEDGGTEEEEEAKAVAPAAVAFGVDEVSIPFLGQEGYKVKVDVEFFGIFRRLDEELSATALS